MVYYSRNNNSNNTGSGNHHFQHLSPLSSSSSTLTSNNNHTSHPNNTYSSSIHTPRHSANLTYRGGTNSTLQNNTNSNNLNNLNNNNNNTPGLNNNSNTTNSNNMILSTSHKDAASAYNAATLVAIENDEDATTTTTSSSFKDKYGVLPPTYTSSSSQDFASLSSSSSSVSGSGHSGHKRPLILFSVDITHWPQWIQFILLVGGLILFMCLYGYYQELVIYGWFDRKLSLFSTFLHFLGCSVFAQLQRHVTSPAIPPPFIHHNNSNSNSNSNNTIEGSGKALSFYQRILTCFGVKASNNSSNNSSNGTNNSADIEQQLHLQQIQHQKMQHWWQQMLRMGTAPPRIAIFYILCLVLTKTFAQGLSNLSMSQMNYPAKVLFKSANPIVTMLIGVIWMKKHYPLRDYFVVVLLLLGLYIFITDNSVNTTMNLQNNTGNNSNKVVNTLPESTPLGILYVTLSMIGSAGVPMIQEYCIVMYHASVEDLIYWSFVGSTVISFFLSIFTGEFFQGVAFVYQSSDSLHTWWIFFAFCTFGFCGANFSTAITAQYGALVNGIANTFRKAVTIGVSFVMFPERNIVTTNKMVGTVVFFLGLIVKIVSKESSSSSASAAAKHTHHHESSQGNMWDTMKRSLSMPAFPVPLESSNSSHNSHGSLLISQQSFNHNNHMKDNNNNNSPHEDQYPTSIEGLWQGIQDGFSSLTLFAHPKRKSFVSMKEVSSSLHTNPTNNLNYATNSTMYLDQVHTTTAANSSSNGSHSPIYHTSSVQQQQQQQPTYSPDRSPKSRSSLLFPGAMHTTTAHPHGVVAAGVGLHGSLSMPQLIVPTSITSTTSNEEEMHTREGVNGNSHYNN